MADLDALLAQLLTYSAAQQNFVFDGDSLTQDGVGMWPRVLNAQLPALGHHTYYNFAGSGANLDNVNGRYNPFVKPLRPTGPILSAWLFMWAGANDIIDGGIVPASWLTMWGNYFTLAKADGFNTVAFTILKRGTDPAVETKRQTINAGIRASSIPDLIVDLDLILPNNEDLVYFNPDKVHLTAAGQALLGDYLAGLMTLPPTPPGDFLEADRNDTEYDLWFKIAYNLQLASGIEPTLTYGDDTILTIMKRAVEATL